MEEKKGPAYFIKRELTTEEYTSRGFPALYFLRDAGKIEKIFAFDLHGNRSDFSVDAFPEGGNVGDVLVVAADGKTWSSRLTDAENSLDAEIVNRAMADANLQNTKLDKPTTDGTWLIKKLGNVFSWVNTDNIGQNVAKFFLETLPNAGINMLANWRIKTNGYKFLVEDLVDKSNDGTFNRFLVNDSSGQVARSNGKMNWLDMANIATQQEKNNFSALWNGGYTANSMSVFLINPMLVQNIDQNTYIVLLGANLNFNPLSFKVEIMDVQGVDVIAVIDNSRVQLNSQGTSLTFYHNFVNIPEGSYKIRLWNGIANYTTQISFVVSASSNLMNVDKSQIIWEKGTYNNLNEPTFNGVFGSVSFQQNLKNLDGSDFDDTTIPNGLATIVGKSNALKLIDGSLLTFNDNFYIEYAHYINADLYSGATHSAGISDIPGMVLNNYLLLGSINYYTGPFPGDNSNHIKSLIGGNSVRQSGSNSTKVIICKINNSVTVVVSSPNGGAVTTTSLASNSANVFLKSVVASQQRTIPINMAMELIQAYKF